METTTGRILLSEIVPEDLPFEIINQVMDKKALGELIDQAYRHLGNKATVILADRLRTLGYQHATRAGISICVDDMMVPPDKERFIAAASEQVKEIEQQYQDGLITDGERYNKVIDIWAEATEQIAGQLLENLGVDIVKAADGSEVRVPSFNPIFMMADSGARGSAQQMRQLAGMRGLMAKPSGEIIETPITSNFREGLSVLQYFISTHGARKGLADTALKTANSGYLTRRLVDVAQDVIVREEDCHSSDGIEMVPLVEGGEIIEAIGERILGRVALEDVRDPITGEVLVPAGVEIDEDRVQADRGGRNRAGRDPLGADLRRPPRRLRVLLRARSGPGRDGESRRSGRCDRGSVDRRAGNPAHHADLPHRWDRDTARGAVAPRGHERGRDPLHEPAPRSGPAGSADRHEPQRRDRAVRRERPRARALPGRLRRSTEGRGRAAGQARRACCSSGIPSRTRS